MYNLNASKAYTFYIPTMSLALGVFIVTFTAFQLTKKPTTDN